MTGAVVEMIVCGMLVLAVSLIRHVKLKNI